MTHNLEIWRRQLLGGQEFSRGSFYAGQRWGLIIRCRWKLLQIGNSERAFEIKGLFDRLRLIIFGGEIKIKIIDVPKQFVGERFTSLASTGESRRTSSYWQIRVPA